MKMLLISLALLSVSPFTAATAAQSGLSTTSSAFTNQASVHLDAVTGLHLTSALKAGRSVAFFSAQGRQVAHAALDARDVARVITDGNARFESATRVVISGPERCVAQSYALMHGTSTNAALMVQATTAQGRQSGMAAGMRLVTLASVLGTQCTSGTGVQTASSGNTSSGTGVTAPGSVSGHTSGNVPNNGNMGTSGNATGGSNAHVTTGAAASMTVNQGTVRLDAATSSQLVSALKAGRDVRFLDAQGQLVAQAKLDARGTAVIVVNGSARFESAARVMISDTRTHAGQNYALVRGTAANAVLMVEASASKSSASRGTVTLASVLNATLGNQVAANTAGSSSGSVSVGVSGNVTGGSNTGKTSGTAASATANQGMVHLDAVTGIRLTSALLAGRDVRFFDAQGQLVAHATLDARGTAHIVTDGSTRFESAIRVMISDTRTHAAQNYALVRGTSASASLMVEASASKGSSAPKGTVTLASVLNAALVSPGTTSPAGSPSGSASTSTSGSASVTGQTGSGSSTQTSGQASGGVSVGTSGQTSGGVSGGVSVGSTGGTSSSEPSGSPSGGTVGGVSVNVGTSGAGSSDPSGSASGGAAVGVSVGGVSVGVGGSGGISVGVGGK